MERRTFFTTAIAAASGIGPFFALNACAGGGARLDSSGKTQWRILSSIGLDAGFALAIAGAGDDVLQAKKHKNRREPLREAMGETAVAAAEKLMAEMKSSGVGVPGAQLALLASTGDVASIEGVIDTFAQEGVFARRFEGSRFFQKPGALEALERRRPFMAAAYEALASSGFERFWRAYEEAKLQTAASRIADELAHVDVITECKRYLSTPLDPRITIYLSEFSEPHGIRIVGQRFITSPNYDTRIVRRNAAHEMLHPLLNNERPETQRILSHLAGDPLLLAIVEKSNPAFGYSSIRGLVEEGAVQALEAVINERLRQEREPAAYWRKQDGGMHLFAAATYHLMKETGFAQIGGDMLSWLDREVGRRRLRGSDLQQRAEAIVGREAVSAWLGG
ncbi:MAG: hypothetical protein AAGA09_00755 [Pseudomonadota bacterium]